MIVYFRNVVQAFKARWQQLGGKIAAEETYQSAGGSQASWTNVVTRLNNEDADVIVTSTAAAFGAQVPILNGLRTLGNNTPFLNSWAGDGNYWYTPDPKITNYFYVTFASAFGNDPVAAVNALAKRNAAAIAKAGSTGGFITGPAAIDGILVALKRTGGNTNGAALAAQMQKFKNVPTLSGLVSFSSQFHTVYGRTYRVISVQNNTPTGRRNDQGQGRPEDLGRVVGHASLRRHGGPEHRSGPPASRVHSTACRRFATSRSSSIDTRSWASSGRTGPGSRHS